MKDKEPMMDIDEVEEVDIENMSMEELREFIAAAEAEVILHLMGECLDRYARRAKAPKCGSYSIQIIGSQAHCHVVYSLPLRT